jgi:hypothetical protein
MCLHKNAFKKTNDRFNSSIFNQTASFCFKKTSKDLTPSQIFQFRKCFVKLASNWKYIYIYRKRERIMLKKHQLHIDYTLFLSYEVENITCGPHPM